LTASQPIKGENMNADDTIRELIAEYCEIAPEDVKGSVVRGYTIDDMPWDEWDDAVNGPRND